MAYACTGGEGVHRVGREWVEVEEFLSDDVDVAGRFVVQIGEIWRCNAAFDFMKLRAAFDVRF